MKLLLQVGCLSGASCRGSPCSELQTSETGARCCVGQWGRSCRSRRSTRWCWCHRSLSATTRSGEGLASLSSALSHPPQTYTRSRRRVPGQQGRSRMAKSSYDFLFCKAQLRWLFNDYMRPGGRSLLHFSPSEDPRLSVTARLRTDIEPEHLGDHSTGALYRRSKRATDSGPAASVPPELGPARQHPGAGAGRRHSHDTLPGLSSGPPELLRREGRRAGACLRPAQLSKTWIPIGLAQSGSMPPAVLNRLGACAGQRRAPTWVLLRPRLGLWGVCRAALGRCRGL